jgi:hypothetical protein
MGWCISQKHLSRWQVIQIIQQHRAIFKTTASYFLPTFRFLVSDLWQAKQSHNKNAVMNVLLLSLRWQLTHQMMTNPLATLVTTHLFQTDPFHSQILQTPCLALLYMSQNFCSEHIKAKSTVHYSAAMKCVVCKTIIVSFS